MSKVKKLLLAALTAAVLGAFTVSAPAHEGHHHEPITKEVAIQRGTLHIEKLVTAGKLEESWKSKAQLQSAELRQNGEAKEWTLTYTNPDARTAEHTLHIVLNENGRYLSGGLKGK